jgi:hypothetical protein
MRIPTMLALTLVLACDEREEVIHPEVEVTVILENNEPVFGNDVHLLAAGETFPCCSVPPQLNRTIERTISYNEFAFYRAGRNGQIIGEATCTCRVNCPQGVRPSVMGPAQPVPQPFTAKVKWDGSNLTCEAPGAANDW